MNSRATLGGIVVVALLVGSYLGGLWPVIPFGNGGSGSQKDGSSADDPQAAEAQTVLVSTTSSDVPVVVRIDGRRYELAEAGGKERRFRQATLEEVLAAAGGAQPNRAGIQVRIERTEESKASAEIELREGLRTAGLADEVIDWTDGPRP